MPFSVIIAPHADDAALSIGCLLSASTDRKHIITCLSRSLEDDFQTEQTAIRTAEERGFANAINADVAFLGLPDSNYRQQPWQTFDHTLPAAILDALTMLLAAKIKRLSPIDRLFIPLAVGLHPDHLLCYYAALRSLGLVPQPPTQLYFYQDIPYAMQAHTLLPSQQLILERGNEHSISVETAEKEALLHWYPSQLKSHYVTEIATDLSHEHVHWVGHNFIKNHHLCSVEHLAQLDGIKLT